MVVSAVVLTARAEAVGRQRRRGGRPTTSAGTAAAEQQQRTENFNYTHNNQLGEQRAAAREAEGGERTVSGR